MSQLNWTISLLEGLGFVNKSHSCSLPKSIQFLDFIVDSQEMSVRLTEQKVATVCKRARQ